MIDPGSCTEFRDFVSIKPAPKQTRFRLVFIDGFLVYPGLHNLIIIIHPDIDRPDKGPATITPPIHLRIRRYGMDSCPYFLIIAMSGCAWSYIISKLIGIPKTLIIAVKSVVMAHQDRYVIVIPRQVIDSVVIHDQVIFRFPESLIADFIQRFSFQKPVIATHYQGHCCKNNQTQFYLIFFHFS